MKHAIIATLALAIVACTGGQINSASTAVAAGADVAGLPAPATIADKTTLDKESLLPAETESADSKWAGSFEH